MKAQLVKRQDRFDLYSESDGSKIASTLPNPMGKLSLKNCEAIENGYDLDELVREACDITDPLRLDSQKYKQDPYFKIGFIKGFQKALSILSDKKFSETELYRAFLINSSGDDFTLNQFFNNTVLPMFQQTEWDCTFNPDEKDSDGCLILRRQNEI